jgi:hypothetical protein
VAEFHPGEFIVACTLLIIGLFVAHAGIIYYCRKVYVWFSRKVHSRGSGATK